ncbi:4-hydroxy-3-methylbut-2-enyl diphosphate reductase [Tolumonas osonensis]|uniref:4-hydroxy-3-methylbut-2-enyl diphosphate reductase n=1 Tax=Tolumonas osonensis TaxID=675874 RepID=A0A841GN92_9GAMM|nr:4-hydroxy-3-methylbut-2-enyl diphosphate reductase [Tolumonas osonensis]MBB6056775.1 4-hydroxy-3-methylbut-2-enyl diphosphate reductase [Tolumonas osonensis]
MKILLANPRGFCAGVDRAITIVKNALHKFGAPIYVRHEVVHNKYVVDELKAMGAIFVDELDEIPDGNTVIFSAHGVPKSVRDEARNRGLQVFDATCPLVTKVHMEVHRASRKGQEVILIGHKGHPEVEGTLGQYDENGTGMYLVEDVNQVDSLPVQQPENISFVTQTTLSVDETRDVINALREHYPAIQGPRKDDICYATQNRQDAVRALAPQVEVMLVVGSKNSSNSNRLRELAERLGTRAYLLDDASQLQDEWFSGVNTVGVTAGASAPEVLVQNVIDRLYQLGGNELEQMNGVTEDTVFEVPAELRI